MNDKEFDKLLKKQMQDDKKIPEKIDLLFSNFESEVNMKEKNRNLKFINYLRTASIAASVMVVTLFGGCTYAHINGNKTIISPLLTKLGINSKYEKNATEFNDKVTQKNVTIKMLNGALDDTSLIVGYEIEIKNNNPDNWLEINGDYKINDISIKPLNTTMDKISDTKYLYYQVFDINEINISTAKDVKIEANIYEIKTYTECETLDSAFAEYNGTFTGKWNFTETIDLKNLQESKIYEFTNLKDNEIIKNVNVSVTEFITGSYTNILKIKTDKTNYDGDDFEKYYKVLNDKNQEIGMYLEEERQYDHRIYNDRLILGNINKNSKIYIEVYLKTIDENNFKKVITIPVDLSKATEKSETISNLKKYTNNKYSFLYKEDWKLTEKLDEDDVGPNSVYLGALNLEIESTTNSEYTSSIYVRTINKNTTINGYKKELQKENTESPSEYYEEKSASKVNFKNQEGYQITAETTDGETIYINKDIFTVSNGKVYVVTFFGSEKEYNNLKSDIDEFISNFEI